MGVVWSWAARRVGFYLLGPCLGARPWTTGPQHCHRVCWWQSPGCCFDFLAAAAPIRAMGRPSMVARVHLSLQRDCAVFLFVCLSWHGLPFFFFKVPW